MEGMKTKRGLRLMKILNPMLHISCAALKVSVKLVDYLQRKFRSVLSDLIFKNQFHLNKENAHGKNSRNQEKENFNLFN
jgi:hypothetical protein